MMGKIEPKEVLALTEKKMTCAEIGAQLGCSAAWVSRIRKSLGISGKVRDRIDFKRPDKKTLEADLRLGRIAMAKKYGVAAGTITVWLRRYGLNFEGYRTMAREPIDTEAVRRLAAQGKTVFEIAEAIGRSVPGVRGHCAANGIRAHSATRRVRPERDELAKQCHNTKDIIAATYGVRPNTVKKWLGMYRLSCARSKPGPQPPEKVQKLKAIRTDYFRGKRSTQAPKMPIYSASPSAIDRALAKVAGR